MSLTNNLGYQQFLEESEKEESAVDVTAMAVGTRRCFTCEDSAWLRKGGYITLLPRYRNNAARRYPLYVAITTATPQRCLQFFWGAMDAFRSVLCAVVRWPNRTEQQHKRDPPY